MARTGDLNRLFVWGYPLPPKTCARKNLPNRSVSGLWVRKFFTPPPHSLHLCQPPKVQGLRSPRHDTRRPGTGPEAGQRHTFVHCPAAAPARPHSRPVRAPGRPSFLRVVTSKHRGHRGQMCKTLVTRCHHWGFPSPVGPGTDLKLPGTPGTTHSTQVHGSADNSGRPLIWCLVNCKTACCSAKQAPAATAHRRPAAMRMVHISQHHADRFPFTGGGPPGLKGEPCKPRSHPG